MKPLSSIIDIRPGERAFSLLMMAYFFLVITIFWILKPLKKGGFLTFYENNPFTFFGMSFNGAQAELFAKFANMFVAFFAVVVFSALSKSLKKHQLTGLFSVFFILCFFFFSLVNPSESELLSWSFYLFGDLFSTLMVATFFISLNDSVTADSAKRLYGLVGLGGVLGGAIGSMLVLALINRWPIYLPWPIDKTFKIPFQMDMRGWMWLCTFLGFLIIAIAYWVQKLPGPASGNGGDPASDPEKSKKNSTTNPAIAGAKLVFKSNYLLAIVSIVGIYEIVSTLVDFQFSATVDYFKSGQDKIQTIASAYTLMNVVALIVQLFFTSYIMKNFGIRNALLVLPVAILAVSSGYLFFPILSIAMLMPSSDGGLAYSLNQSAKEALYVPTSKEEKYKAKAFIDMFVQRFAKVIAIVVTLIITYFFKDFSTIRWLSLGTMAALLLWLIAVSYAGKKFDSLSPAKLKTNKDAV